MNCRPSHFCKQQWRQNWTGQVSKVRRIGWMVLSGSVRKAPFWLGGCGSSPFCVEGALLFGSVLVETVLPASLWERIVGFRSVLLGVIDFRCALPKVVGFRCVVEWARLFASVLAQVMLLASLLERMVELPSLLEQSVGQPRWADGQREFCQLAVSAPLGTPCNRPAASEGILQTGPLGIAPSVLAGRQRR
jgi:hypothetical protein